MKIYICSKLKMGAWGGGNQFLKALRAEFLRRNLYADSLTLADILIFNGYQDSLQLIGHWFKRRRPKLVYRLGPVLYLHRGIKWKIVDLFVVRVANLCADLIIFQSQWSYDMAVGLGLNKKKKYFIVRNAVDSSIFFKDNSLKKTNFPMVNLVYTSWSTNPNKGFAYLDFLDKNLDFKKFKLRFIGNSPITFENIELIKPLPSIDLAQELRKSDLYISPAKDDACSNAILEALACGLPVVALNSGSNGELVGQGGVLFEDNQALLSSVFLVAKNLESYQAKIVVKSIKTVCDEYLIAIKSLYDTINF